MEHARNTKPPFRSPTVPRRKQNSVLEFWSGRLPGVLLGNAGAAFECVAAGHDLPALLCRVVFVGSPGRSWPTAVSAHPNPSAGMSSAAAASMFAIAERKRNSASSTCEEALKRSRGAADLQSLGET